MLHERFSREGEPLSTVRHRFDIEALLLEYQRHTIRSWGRKRDGDTEISEESNK